MAITLSLYCQGNRGVRASQGQGGLSGLRGLERGHMTPEGGDYSDKEHA